MTEPLASLFNKKVLIIEDEQPMAKAMEFKLNKAGATALAVFSGDVGLQELAKVHYDVVLLDIMLPGMDGWQVLRLINQQYGATVKVIVASNLGQDADIAKAKALGSVEFLVKSDSSLDDIVAAVARHLT